jgi:hypothetical protein
MTGASRGQFRDGFELSGVAHGVVATPDLHPVGISAPAGRFA